ncbi:MAG TPA: hypothetical protein VFA33_07535 [Bryobacteraceae bacterium]|nr:hypothetical protein [Bryobacteraceae bacterium]
MPKKQYPKWKRSLTGDSRIVHDPAEEAALGPDWLDTLPAQAPVDPLAALRAERDRLAARCAELAQQLEAIRADAAERKPAKKGGSR